MRDKIMINDNITNFVSMVEALLAKPERMDRLGLLYGKWGFGKTTTIEWYYTNNSCHYVRAMAAWGRSVNMMIEDILRAYRVEARGRFKQDIRELIQVAKKQRLPLFIDEADRVVKKSILIETIRDLHDLAKIPIILIGQENIVNLLQRRDLGQVFSRITEIVEYKEISTPDIQRISKELCDLKCDVKVASYIRNITLGDFRLINALFIKAEGICALNKMSEITLAIVKEAATSVPSADELNKAIEREDIIDRKSLMAVG